MTAASPQRVIRTALEAFKARLERGEPSCDWAGSAALAVPLLSIAHSTNALEFERARASGLSSCSIATIGLLS